VKLTQKQDAVLTIVCDSPSGHATIEDIAFEAQTTPQAAGRIVQALSKDNLLTRQRFAGGKWEIWPTDKGRAVLAGRRS
jgi:DNA-binding MarR family transcriptional regulator